MEEKTLEQLIAEINALARKARTEDLTAAESAQQQALRARYIQIWRDSVQAQLDNTYYLDEKGNKHKLRKKED